MTQDPAILFLENLMTEAGLTNLPKDYRAQYMLKLQDELNQRIGMIIMENLDEKDAKEFSKLIDQKPLPGATQMQKFFADKIPGLEQKIKDGMVLFAQQFLSAVKK
jgi:hypothetical protein